MYENKSTRLCVNVVFIMQTYIINASTQTDIYNDTAALVYCKRAFFKRGWHNINMLPLPKVFKLQTDINQCFQIRLWLKVLLEL